MLTVFDILLIDLFSFTALEDTTLALDFQVTAPEENGGGDGNSSVADLELRVETLEGTAADHETRISAAQSDINCKKTVFVSKGLCRHILGIYIPFPIWEILGSLLRIHQLTINTVIRGKQW